MARDLGLWTSFLIRAPASGIPYWSATAPTDHRGVADNDLVCLGGQVKLELDFGRANAMSMMQQSSALPSMAPAPVPADEFFPWSVDQYHEMIDAGILTEDDPVELLEGCLVKKMPKKPSHSATTTRTWRALYRLVPSGWRVMVQAPVTTDTSEPEPDVTLVRGDEEQYEHRQPSPEDVALLVEVSDSTLQRDRGSMKRLYARARIPVYWVINLIDHQVEVYAEPSGPGQNPDYQQGQVFGPSGVIPVVIGGREVSRIAVRDLHV